MRKRATKVTRNYLIYPAGSVLIETGKTKIICTVTIEDSIPRFLKEKETPQGWLTAEYSMLPGSTDIRFRRERGKTNSRSTEIQRLIGRSLRAVVDLKKIPGRTVFIDCDVIQADGGTRTASITGSCIALHDAFKKLMDEGIILENPLKEWVAAISVGIVNSKIVVDLDYEKDSNAEVDMNVIMTESGKFIEIQGTAETEPFTDAELSSMLAEAKKGIKQLIKFQKLSIKSEN